MDIINRRHSQGLRYVGFNEQQLVSFLQTTTIAISTASPVAIIVRVIAIRASFHHFLLPSHLHFPYPPRHFRHPPARCYRLLRAQLVFLPVQQQTPKLFQMRYMHWLWYN